MTWQKDCSRVPWPPLASYSSQPSVTSRVYHYSFSEISPIFWGTQKEVLYSKRSVFLFFNFLLQRNLGIKGIDKSLSLLHIISSRQLCQVLKRQWKLERFEVIPRSCCQSAAMHDDAPGFRSLIVFLWKTGRWLSMFYFSFVWLFPDPSRQSKNSRRPSPKGFETEVFLDSERSSTGPA